MDLATHITGIGRRMVACKQDCDGILLDPRRGILPRFLILEAGDCDQTRGSAIIGINPGRSTNSEREFYIARGQTYLNTIEYWQKKICTRKYYKWLRLLVNQLGFVGPILWTELAKCEKDPVRRGLLPLHTFRICMATYLQMELEAPPNTWPLVAVGAEPYKAMAYRFPDRAVIGVPHPTGSYGHFHNLFDGERLRPGVRTQITGILEGESKKAVWLQVST